MLRSFPIRNYVLFFLVLLSLKEEIRADFYSCHEICGYPVYCQVLGGVNFLQTKERDDIKPQYDPGFFVAGSIGYRSFGWQMEVECAYRNNKLNKVEFFGESFKRNGHFHSLSLMGNLVWDIPLPLFLQPYMGGGIGYDEQQTLTRGFGFSVKENKKHFAWQLIGGVKYALPCELDVFLEYRFHQGGFSHIHCHTLDLGLSYQFGVPS